MNQIGERSAGLQHSDLLDQQINAMETVLACLETERAALEKRDVELLLEIAEKKTASLVAAEQIDRQRRSADSTAPAGDPDHLGREQRLKALTETCREINDTNGRMIRAQSRRVDDTLRLLRGDRGPSVIYEPDGSQSNRTSARKLLTSV